MQQTQSKLPIIGFVLSFLVPPAGVVVSIIALNKTNANRGLSIAGIIIGGLQTVVFVVVMIPVFIWAHF